MCKQKIACLQEPFIALGQLLFSFKCTATVNIQLHPFYCMVLGRNSLEVGINSIYLLPVQHVKFGHRGLQLSMRGITVLQGIIKLFLGVIADTSILIRGDVGRRNFGSVFALHFNSPGQVAFALIRIQVI